MQRSGRVSSVCFPFEKRFLRRRGKECRFGHLNYLFQMLLEAVLFIHNFSTFIIRKEVEVKFCKGRCYFQIFLCVVSPTRSQAVMLTVLALGILNKTPFSPLGTSNDSYCILSLSGLPRHLKSSDPLLLPSLVFTVCLAM